jgi:hypothetical protein
MRKGQRNKWVYVSDPQCGHVDCKTLDLPAQVSIPQGSSTKHRCIHHLHTPQVRIRRNNAATAELLRKVGLL